MSTFAIECRQRYRLPSVNVNAIGYGPILTRMTQEGKQDIQVGGEEITMGLPEGAHEAIQERVLLGRMADPSEAANGIYFLVGPDSAFFTGKILWMDGVRLSCCARDARWVLRVENSTSNAKC